MRAYNAEDARQILGKAAVDVDPIAPEVNEKLFNRFMGADINWTGTIRITISPGNCATASSLPR
jgi:hypothetical protein